jgi:NAD(P)-dependent dehydrogenase (short-subunit alcohol dehydrogenase family)
VNVDYAAAKAALRNLTQALSAEYAPRGIRVNTVSPSAVLTAWTQDGGAADIMAAHSTSDSDMVINRLAPEKTGHLTGRLIDPQEVADVIALLASPRSASTTGADFSVDAGFIKAF